MDTFEPDPWFPMLRSTSSAASRPRLLCLPCAGAGIAFFRDWLRPPPEGVELVPVLLPGRERRLREAPIVDMQALVEQLVPRLERFVGGPWAIFGYSLGGLIGAALVDELGSRGLPLPERLIVANAAPPHRPAPRPPLHLLPDAAFLREVVALGGIPAEVLAADELVELTLPCLRADFRLGETWSTARPLRLRCPVTVVSSEGDAWVDEARVRGWEDLVEDPVEFMVDGEGHFGPMRDPAAFRDRVLRAIGWP